MTNDEWRMIKDEQQMMKNEGYLSLDKMVFKKMLLGKWRETTPLSFLICLHNLAQVADCVL